MIGCFYGAFRMMEVAQYYEDTKTSQKCEIVDYDIVECAYECNCHGVGQCDTCFGTAYEYAVAVNPSLCGKMLRMHEGYTTSQCPMSFREPGSRYECYLDCEEGVFAFSASDDSKPDGVIVFA